MKQNETVIGMFDDKSICEKKKNEVKQKISLAL